ncbi:MAG TPA: ATP-binding protein, partial [Ktedonobacterales bacterium]|nr:ATP-binding protein [Ktedonobacterales bacterium]
TAMTQSSNRPVGITKGPGETIHEYTFISRDEQRLLKNGEYVYYELENLDSGRIGNSALSLTAGSSSDSGKNGSRTSPLPVGGARGAASDHREAERAQSDAVEPGVRSRRVLGRILRRVPVQLYPDTFLSEPEVPPSQVAALVGYDARASDLFELHVGILGYYDTALGTFVNPWIPPSSGTAIYLADDALLADVLSRKRRTDTGSAEIGSLLTRREGAVPVVLDVKEVVSTHLAIIASTGAGKSYLASVILEELMRPYNRAAVLIVDPHGEYGTLQEMANRPEFAEAEADEHERGARRYGPRYRAATRVFLHDQVKVRLSTLTLGDLRYLLPGLTDKQHHFLGRAYEAVTKGKKGHHWTAEELKAAVARVGNDKNEESGDDSGNSTIAALSWKIDERLGNNTMVFDPHLHLDLREVLKPGQCTVLQLNEIDERDQQVIVATLLRRLYNARLNTEKGKVQPGDEMYLPYPVFVLLEEAHHFAPHGGDVVTTNILKQALAEGRKFGIGVGLISQRPGKLDPDVLSQCLTQCIMRIVNEVDQKSVATAVEGVGRDLLDNLPSLSKGQAIIAGAAVNTPVICRVRTRLTPHGGESKDAPAEWLRSFGDDAVAARTRESSGPARNNDPISI